MKTFAVLFIGLCATRYTFCANAQVLLSEGSTSSNGINAPFSSSRMMGLEMGNDEVGILLSYSINSNSEGCNEISYLSVEHRDAGTVNGQHVRIAATKTRTEIPDTPPSESTNTDTDDDNGEPYIRDTPVYKPPTSPYHCKNYKYLIQIKLWQGRRTRTVLVHTISLTNDGEIKYEGPIAGKIVEH